MATRNCFPAPRLPPAHPLLAQDACNSYRPTPRTCSSGHRAADSAPTRGRTTRVATVPFVIRLWSSTIVEGGGGPKISVPTSGTELHFCQLRLPFCSLCLLPHLSLTPFSAISFAFQSLDAGTTGCGSNQYQHPPYRPPLDHSPYILSPPPPISL